MIRPGSLGYIHNKIVISIYVCRISKPLPFLLLSNKSQMLKYSIQCGKKCKILQLALKSQLYTCKNWETQFINISGAKPLRVWVPCEVPRVVLRQNTRIVSDGIDRTASQKRERMRPLVCAANSYMPHFKRDTRGYGSPEVTKYIATHMHTCQPAGNKIHTYTHTGTYTYIKIGLSHNR